MRCAGAISGPAVRQFALAPRCLLASALQDASIIDSALALLQSKRSPNRRPAGLVRPPGPSRVLVPRIHLLWVYVGT